MRHWILSLILVTATQACGGAGSAANPAAVDRTTPAATTTAYLAAAQTANVEAMLALMTPECREKEKAGERAFTKAIGDGKIKLKTHDMRPPEVTGDTAKVSVKAVFIADGKDDNEGMRFELKLQDGAWLITSIG